jgi:hypothetical protein
LALIYYSELLPTAFFLALDLVVPVVAATHAGSLCSLIMALSAALSVDPKMCSLLDQAAYSVDAQDQLSPVLAFLISAKPAVYRTVALNPLFPLAGESVLIPKTDKQAQKQPCAPYWNADKELCLARHHELHAHDDVDRPSPSVQVLDSKWVFDLKINTTSHILSDSRHVLWLMVNLRSLVLTVMMFMLLQFL